MKTLEAIPSIALKPDGSSESIYCAGGRIGDLDRFGRPITLPARTVVIPFDGDLFVVVPSYAEAVRLGLGQVRV